MVMLSMYGSEKQVTIYVTTENNLDSNNHTNHLCANRYEPHDEYDAELCPSEESYHSHLDFDNEDNLMNDDDVVYPVSKNSIRMEVDSKFENVVDFRRSLNQFAVTNEFNYYIQKSDLTRFTTMCENLECEWRINSFITQDEVTFELVPEDFVDGCRPYIGLDACHLKEKFNGVLAAATGVDVHRLTTIYPPPSLLCFAKNNHESLSGYTQLLN
ncbi:unnamed protein product [Lactuca saligna]|uniref:Transposase MuDR plant domain-containing protein n=1 Tax=Lactuca saligna TaxID=75948 RepID=A0AA35VG89_LACSI|nr:unnamed protein product [Lactuca saligna]